MRWNDKEMVKVTKAKVKGIISKKGTVNLMLVPCKANIKSPWVIPYYREDITTLEELEKVVASFEVYNCNSEMGYYPHYYIEA